MWQAQLFPFHDSAWQSQTGYWNSDFPANTCLPVKWISKYRAPVTSRSYIKTRDELEQFVMAFLLSPLSPHPFVLCTQPNSWGKNVVSEMFRISSSAPQSQTKTSSGKLLGTRDCPCVFLQMALQVSFWLCQPVDLDPYEYSGFVQHSRDTQAELRRHRYPVSAYTNLQ